MAPPETVRHLDPDRGVSRLERAVPAVRWLRSYDGSAAARDALAGLVVAALLLPQAMAYALLADLPPRVGLYAATVPAVAYALFGSSRFLAVGPVALVSLLTGEAIARTAAAGADPVQVALALAALVGLALVGGGLLGLGIVTDFLGKPVLDGFAAGAAVLIAASQLRPFLGIEGERAAGFLDSVERLVADWSRAHGPTVAVGLACLGLILAVKRWLDPALRRAGVGEALRRPLVQSAPLVAVGGAIAATALLDLDARGVATVAPIDLGLPPVGFVDSWTAIPWLSLAPSALVIALVTFVLGFAVGRSVEHDGEPVQPDREMLGLGAANLAAAVTGGYPVGASVSRSAVSRDVGSRTPLGPVMAGVVVLAAAWFAGPLLDNLPEATLAALIMVAAIGLVDVTGMWRTWRYDRGDGAVLLTTFASVILLGVDRGLTIGAVAGLLLYLSHTSRPRVVVEGRREGSERFASGDHDHVEEVKKTPVMVIRIDADLYFGNTRHVRDRIIEEVTGAPHLEWLLLDLSSVAAIDRTAYTMLEQLRVELAGVEVALAVSEIKLPLRRKLSSSGLLGVLGSERVFTDLHRAVETLEARCRVEDPPEGEDGDDEGAGNPGGSDGGGTEDADDTG